MRYALTAAVVMIAFFFAFAADCFAGPQRSAGEFQQFGSCPTELPQITDCVYSISNEGGFKIGTRAAPLARPLTLQGAAEGSGEGVKFYGANNGETLSSAPQEIAGGLQGVVAPTSWPAWLQKWFNEGVEEGSTAVLATIELTGPSEGLTGVKLNTEHLLLREGVALGLPVRFRLSNPVLGSSCDIGSDSKPVQLNFTTGRSGSVSGSPGDFSGNKAFTLATIKGARLVDGRFAVPKASGCGGLFSSFVDPLVDATLGLPSAAGRNTSVLEGTLKDATAEVVRKGE